MRFPRVHDRENATEGSLRNCFKRDNARVVALIACYAAGRRGGREGSSIHDVRLNGWLAPFAALRGARTWFPRLRKRLRSNLRYG